MAICEVAGNNVLITIADLCSILILFNVRKAGDIASYMHILLVLLDHMTGKEGEKSMKYG